MQKNIKNAKKHKKETIGVWTLLAALISKLNLFQSLIL